MTRLDLAENMRRLRHEASRDPVDNAFRAFVALSADDRAAAVERFNAASGEDSRLGTLTYIAVTQDMLK